IIGFIGFRSNCIVHDINAKEQLPMTQTEIAEKIGSSKNTVSRLIKQLIEKGLIGRFESGRDGINARMYALYINPNMILCGDRDNINQTLQTMFIRKPKELKNLPIKLV
ncbi:MarR family winged helix-turn-helix transcriptional regulator, partial [Bacillus cereus]